MLIRVPNTEQKKKGRANVLSSNIFKDLRKDKKRTKEYRKTDKELTSDELSEVFKKMGYSTLTGQAIRKIEMSTNPRQLNVNEYEAYSKVFNVSVDYLMGLSEIPSKDEDIKMICKSTGLTQESVETIKALKKNKNKHKDYTSVQLIDMLNIILADKVLCEMFLDTLSMLIENPFDTQKHYDKEEKALIDDTVTLETLKDIEGMEVISLDENYIIVGSTKDKELRRFVPLSFLDTYNKERLFDIIRKYKELYESKGSD